MLTVNTADLAITVYFPATRLTYWTQVMIGLRGLSGPFAMLTTMTDDNRGGTIDHLSFRRKSTTGKRLSRLRIGSRR